MFDFSTITNYDINQINDNYEKLIFQKIEMKPEYQI